MAFRMFSTSLDAPSAVSEPPLMMSPTPPTALDAPISTPFTSSTVTAEAVSRSSALSITSSSDRRILLSWFICHWASCSFSIRPLAMSSLSRPRALNTELAVVRAPATFSMMVLLISSCTAVLALPVILGAMAFFFSFS